MIHRGVFFEWNILKQIKTAIVDGGFDRKVSKFWKVLVTYKTNQNRRIRGAKERTQEVYKSTVTV